MNAYHDDSSPTRMFGDTIMYRQSKQFRRASAPKPGPPPTLPAPVPTPVVPASYPKNNVSQSHSFSSAVATSNNDNRRSMPTPVNYSKQSSSNKPKPRNGVTNASLHSSNDSGFANDPPPQPDVDYSDEETLMRVPLRSHPKESVSTLTKQKSRIPRRSNDKIKRSSREIENNSAKSYGPWYDLWAGEGTLKKAAQFATVKLGLRSTKTNDRSAPLI
ncbi:hypothetical protein Bhyg_13292 [Pseudolycoriella hygida]|uniref:Uncharacterized protein n=1 Tax=Pseudolycoriella hygida TaxID=35572 RepID=A0A9Q0MMK7_9DIPT|nr:hypothetical protein Bhyg_13292 [Pseudolycoriella hygida]